MPDGNSGSKRSIQGKAEIVPDLSSSQIQLFWRERSRLSCPCRLNPSKNPSKSCQQIPLNQLSLNFLCRNSCAELLGVRFFQGIALSRGMQEPGHSTGAAFPFIPAIPPQEHLEGMEAPPCASQFSDQIPPAPLAQSSPPLSPVLGFAGK